MRNCEPCGGPGAGGFDLAAMVGDDAIDDRQAQAGPLPAALAGEERLEQMLEHFVRSCRSHCR